MLTKETMEKYARRYQKVSDLIKTLEAEKKKLRDTFAENSEGYEKKEYGAWVCDWIAKPMPRVDTKRLFEEHPEIEKADYMTTNTVYNISLKRK